MPRSLSEQSAPASGPASGRAASSADAPSALSVVLRQLGWFTGIGVVMTLAYLALYAVLRLGLGPQWANLIAWVATAVADTSANRRYTFGLFGRTGAARAQVEGLVVFGIGLAITSGSLVALEAAVSDPGRTLELVVLAVANLVAGLLRFVLLRWWVFAPSRTTPQSGPRALRRR